MSLTLAALAEYIGVPVAELQAAGITEFQQNGAKAVRVPYHDSDGNIVFHRWRDSLDGHWMQPKGTRLIPFGLERLGQAHQAGMVTAVEGETDTFWLWHCGVPTIGVPGASSWKDDWCSHLDGIDMVHVVQENDSQGGETFVRRFRESAIADRCRLVRLPDGVKDVLELGKRDPAGFAEAWEECVDQAAPLRSPPRIRWLDTEGLAGLPDPSWLVHEILPEGGLSMLFGKADHGKTFVGLDLALSIATGTAWHGHDVQQAAVAYVVGEGQNWILQRIGAWKAQNEWDRPLDAFFTIDRLSLMEPGDVDDMLRGLKQLPPARLVICDTLNRTMGIGDESSTQD
ncbi:MAG: ATP-binding protein, partial [Thermocrispum sp.]